MPMVLMPDIERKFLKTLIDMWADPVKRRGLESDGVTQRMVDDAQAKLEAVAKG